MKVTHFPYLGVMQQSPTFLALGTSFMEDNLSRDGGGQFCMQPTSCASADETLLHPLITYVAQFLSGHGLVLVHSPGLGTPSAKHG
uniref:Uncharacterized protein n=1 Tax=Laticauda laticaudata TaxID=8630 RepID=A0A8C5WPD7_LATLA